MTYRLFFTGFFCAIAFYNSFSVETKDTSELTIVFAGDVMGHDSQINSAYNPDSNKYEYDSCFKYISPYIKQHDIAVANLEVTLAGQPFKGYPQFSSPDELAIALQNNGFNIFLTANNHSLDRGRKGVERTIDILDSLNIIHTGTFKNDSIKNVTYPLIIEKNNIRLAILNYTYGTNGLKVTRPNIVNYIDTNEIKKDLEKARSAMPDFIIVTVHWGTEYERSENKVQSETADFIFSNGADLIIGSHPHVVQPVKKYYKSEADTLSFNIVVYSLGNYISNQRKRYTDGGIMFSLKLTKSVDSIFINSFEYLPTWVYKPVKENKTYFTIIPANASIYGITDHEIPKTSIDDMKIFYDDTKKLLPDVPESNYKY